MADDREERCPFPRPPGALPEESFLLRCTRCDRCVVVCPNDVLRRHPDDGSPWAGTPVLDTNERACHLCEDQPCSGACEEGALVLTPRSEVMLGIAWLDRTRCIAWTGEGECDACVTACPDAQLILVEGKPVIPQDVCYGCGTCREACPLDPPAIEIQHG